MSPRQRKITGLVSKLLQWFPPNARDLPWRRTRDPYAVWVSEIMLQQTQVKTVIPYWERWMRELPTLQSLAAAKSETIHKLWEGLGYYTRVRNLQKAARQITAQHAGEFPRAHEAILDLPGIGRYTAGAISSIAYNEPRPILDGNVIRVLTRLFGLAENPRGKSTNEKLWRLAAQLVTAAAKSPPSASPLSPTQHGIRNPSIPACSHLNQSLMELGALICAPQQPKCPLCPVRPHCVAHRARRVHELPNLGPRPRATSRRFAAFVIKQRGRLLVRQRPAGAVNARLWEFPNLDLAPGQTNLRHLARKTLGLTLGNLRKLLTVKHSITRHRITLDAYHADLVIQPDSGKTTARNRRLKLDQLNLLAFTGAHKKILKCLMNRD